LIWDPEQKKYLLLRRAAARDFHSGSWECVTGRVDQGESFVQALHREVKEEAGVDVQIDFIIATTHFYRGEEVPENELLGVIYGCTLIANAAGKQGIISNQRKAEKPVKIQISSEHSEMRWLSAQEALDFLPSGSWLHETIRRAEILRLKLPEELRELNRREV